MRAQARPVLILVAAALMVLIAGQALATSAAPTGGRSETGRVLSRTGFAFLGGMRTFAAAVLWNRLDPLLHGYYDGTTLAEQRWALPTYQLVTTLDPQFVQAYYEASYNVIAMGDFKEGLRIAREGINNNPQSGLMRANLAQLLIIQDKKRNLPEALELTEQGLDERMYWNSADDLFDGLVIFRTVYSVAGDKAAAEELNRRIVELEQSGLLSHEEHDHDHDHDGIQDH
jgi:hypothetical protein